MRVGAPNPYSRDHLLQILTQWHRAPSSEHPELFPGPLAGKDKLTSWVQDVGQRAQGRNIPRQQWANALLAWIPVAPEGETGFKERLLKLIRKMKREGYFQAGRFWNWEQLKHVFFQLCGLAAVGSAIALPLIGIPLLGAIGFTSAGVAGGSIAAGVQSAVYGGATGGVFSVLQSIGARAAFPVAYNFVAGAIGAGAAAAAGQGDTSDGDRDLLLNVERRKIAIIKQRTSGLVGNGHVSPTWPSVAGPCHIRYKEMKESKFRDSIAQQSNMMSRVRVLRVGFLNPGSHKTVMTTEETPLLPNKHDLVYERFSAGKKRLLVAIVSWGGLVAFFTSGTFVPSIPQVAKDLDSTGEVIRASAEQEKQMAVDQVTYAQTVQQLMFWRFIQGMGASPGLSVGAGVIGDIYRLEERGAALGSYFGTGLLGLALAPTIGGVTAHYWSWRGIHYGLAVFALGALFCIFFFFPETSHPGTRGVDELKRSGKTHPKGRPVMLNPLAQLLMLRSPNILAVGKRYGIENEALIGACFLPLGIGNAIGAPLAGWISDKMVIRYKKIRGYWYPEDRLRACLYSFYLPITVLASGLITKYVPGKLGLALNFVCFFLNGVGCDIALTPCGAYVVDVLHGNSAEVTAAVNAFRSVALAITTAMLLPMINNYGHVFTNGVVAVFALTGFFITIITIIYGDSMRAWVDIGYSNADEN
ncbi:hypothetical protein D9756_008837 [Leucocoprinus leucothites]|uniref:Major facilitator superfamily (MFS) profile domain-containing protein n=1 Tax=Leucocoprinus leucothites TaxID=201217 RepID=A0A8H5D011_9AGAR|nr:hypothetical protein D9756_008837 [Leucoagaricus leucothites]